MSELSRAKAEAALSRQRLVQTARELRGRLQPGVIAGDAKAAAWRKSEEIADQAVDAVKSRPVAASAAVAGVTAFLGFRLINRFRKKSKSSSDD